MKKLLFGLTLIMSLNCFAINTSNEVSYVDVVKDTATIQDYTTKLSNSLSKFLEVHKILKQDADMTEKLIEDFLKKYDTFLTKQEKELFMAQLNNIKNLKKELDKLN